MSRLLNRENIPSNVDYPNDYFEYTPMSEASAIIIAKALNKEFSGATASRYWDVVPDTYIIEEFEP